MIYFSDLLVSFSKYKIADAYWHTFKVKFSNQRM